MKRFVVAAIAALPMILGVVPAYGDEQSEINKSKNVGHVSQVKYTGGTELAADGKYVYSGELDGGPEYPSRGTEPDKGGLHIFDVSKGAPLEVGFLHCPGNDNDVEVLKPGIVAVGHHTNKCNVPQEGADTDGVIFVDVRKANKPRIVGKINLPSGSSSHTIRPMPGGRYVYVNPGGLPTNGGANLYIIDAKDPTKPKIAAVFGRSEGGPVNSCHDLSFNFSKKGKLAFCSGYGETSIWDVSDPVAPEIIGRIHNPLIEFHHYPVGSSDGKLLAIDDEAFALHECHSGQSPTGRVWIYDISDPTAPVLASSFAPPRGGDGTVGHFLGWIPSWCLSHGLDWEPGTHNLAVTWFTGGVSVLSLEDPTAPEEVAYFQASDSATYSALWHKGVLYTNDSARGLDALTIKGL